MPAPSLREIAQTLFLQSLADCTIAEAFARNVRRISVASGKFLKIHSDLIPLDGVRRIGVVSVGKAATAMLEALLPSLTNLPGCDLRGVLIAPEAPPRLPDGFEFFAGGHPMPTQDSIDGAGATLRMLESLRAEGVPARDALCLFLISGGGSAMMELPLALDIPLEDVIGFHREMVHSSASITEINCVRKHFSAIKGGRLALAAKDIPSYSLLISDVPPGHLDALASGPTLPDNSTVEQCSHILERYNLLPRFPCSVRHFFSSEGLQETPKPGDLRTRACVLLAPEDLADIARRRAEALGFHTIVDNTCDDWDYRRAAVYLLDRLRQLRRDRDRVCIVSSGEVAVEVPAAAGAGQGGRNQHFALYASTLLGPADAHTGILSAGTDGIDGNSPAAGAVVDENTLSARPGGFAHACSALQSFASGAFLQEAGLTIVTGATGTNLRDLRILLASTQ